VLKPQEAVRPEVFLEFLNDISGLFVKAPIWLLVSSKHGVIAARVGCCIIV